MVQYRLLLMSSTVCCLMMMKLIKLILSTDMCAICNEGISADRPGCTALSQTYHLDCFVCSVCKNRLAGGSFYAVDGKPYCEDDYTVRLPITRHHFFRCSGRAANNWIIFSENAREMRYLWPADHGQGNESDNMGTEIRFRMADRQTGEWV